MSEQNNDLGNFLAGLIIGGLMGAAAALLMAPQSGEETRAVIREKGIELKDKATEQAEDARLRAERLLDETRMKADETVVTVRSKAEEAAQKAKEKATDLQARGQSLLDEQKGKIAPLVDATKKVVDEASKKLDTGTGSTATPDAANNEPSI